MSSSDSSDNGSETYSFYDSNVSDSESEILSCPSLHEQACDFDDRSESNNEDSFVAATRRWAIRVPIGLGLCPWAVKSRNLKRLRIVTCDGSMPSDAVMLIENEICSLTCNQEKVVPFRTTLVICPHILEWNDFIPFEEFVRNGLKQQLLGNNDELLDKVTLVAFHPAFLKWHALPPSVQIGSNVYSYWGMVGQKSVCRAEATIVEMENRAFGLRKVKVRFEEVMEGRRQEQYVPVEWIGTSVNSGSEACTGPPLPDNFMYRSPCPTIHIIDNRDLASLCVSDVSRVKRLNGRRMAKLGWEGIEEHMQKVVHR